jgi:carboxyl-terminal processing protease
MRLPSLLVLLVACGEAPRPAPPPPRPVEPVVTAPEVVTPTPKPKPPPVDPRLAADIASFDQLWQAVADTFWDPKYDGVDWNGIRDELRPKVLASKSRDEARLIMADALHRLGKTHFGIAPSEDSTPGAPDGDAEPGLDLRMLGSDAVIVTIEADSPAAKSKLRPGMVIESVNDVALAPVIAAAGKEPTSLTPLYQVRAVMNLVKGQAGTKVTLRIKGEKQPFEIERAHIGRTVSFGNLGNEPLIYESRMLDKATAYIRLSIFLDPGTVMPQLEKDLVTFAKAKGLIIDLRGNPGGIGGMAMGITGHLVNTAGLKLGTMKTRASSLDFVINPQNVQFTGKVAVLIDEMSASTSEILAGGLQDLHRARIFGRTSPGAALPSVVDKLPNGDRFQYAIANYTSTGGKVLEGHGVTPDTVVPLDLKTLRGRQDPVIVAATKWLAGKENP